MLQKRIDWQLHWLVLYGPICRLKLLILQFQEKLGSKTFLGNLRKINTYRLITAVASYSPLGHLFTWNWLRTNWKALIDIWGNDDFTRFNDMLERVVSRFIQPILIDEAESLFIEKSDPDFFLPPRSELSVAKGLEFAKQKTKWLELNEENIQKWLATELKKYK